MNRLSVSRVAGIGSLALPVASVPRGAIQSSSAIPTTVKQQAKRLRSAPTGSSAGAQKKKISRSAMAASAKQLRGARIDQRQRLLRRVNPAVLSQQLDRAFREADKDRDGKLSSHEVRTLLTSRFSLKVVPTNPDSHATTRPTNHQLKLVMIGSAIPFVGFGFVDNIIMLAAGDMIEIHFHETYAMSMLCAAALGNTVSDVVGLSLGGIIESFARRVGIPDPGLSKAQANMAITHWANFAASAGGITLGCLIGMFPLLFMNHDDDDDDDDDKGGKKSKAADKPAVEDAAVSPLATTASSTTS
jgi:hypothetical protein